MKLFKNSFLLILATTLIISACNQLKTEWKTFTASNKYTVEYPSFLSPDNTLTTEASMSYSNQKKEFFFVLFDGRRAAVAAGVYLIYSSLYLDHISWRVRSGRMAEPNRQKEGRGNKQRTINKEKREKKKRQKR